MKVTIKEVVKLMELNEKRSQRGGAYYTAKISDDIRCDSLTATLSNVTDPNGLTVGGYYEAALDLEQDRFNYRVGRIFILGRAEPLAPAVPAASPAADSPAPKKTA